MKRTVLDRIVGFFSPASELRRIKARGNTELVLRAYDAAESFATDDWSSATIGSANAEIRGAIATLRNKGSDADRNNPWAGAAIDGIVTHTVGPGILPQIRGKTKLQTRKVVEAWKEWAHSNKCDSELRNNFYMMESLVMRSMIERGEALGIKEINPEGFQIRLLESDLIASEKDTGSTVQGIKTDDKSRVKSYFLYEKHPGDQVTSTKIIEFPVEKVLHVFKQKRIGQLRGVSWLHNVVRTLEDLNQYEQATLIGKKIAACFAAFITTNGNDATLAASDLIAKREAENMLNPGSVRYLARDESITFSTPPKVDGYDEYSRNQLRKIATGLGITYELLTKDYSQVNYSSARAAHLVFKKNVEDWRWNILIPKFCEPAFQHFLEWCRIVKGINTDGVTVEWIPPTWEMLDPGKEIQAMTDGIRAGLISYQRACKELGYEPEDMLAEIAEHNEKLDKLGIIIDSDPRKVSKAGQMQMTNPSQQNPSIGTNSEKENKSDKVESNES